MNLETVPGDRVETLPRGTRVVEIDERDRLPRDGAEVLTVGDRSDRFVPFAAYAVLGQGRDESGGHGQDRRPRNDRPMQPQRPSQPRPQLAPSPRPRPERRVLVEVPESALRQLPPGARVVESGIGQGMGGGRHRHGGGSEVELSFGRDAEVELSFERGTGYDGGYDRGYGHNGYGHGGSSWELEIGSDGIELDRDRW